MSAVAIVISLGSLGWAIYLGVRDRAELVVTAELVGDGSGYIRVTVVNEGRRPTLIYRWGATTPDGQLVETYKLGVGRDYGVSLPEHERYEFSVSRGKLRLKRPDGERTNAKNFWVEDGLSRRHYPENAAELTAQLLSG